MNIGAFGESFPYSNFHELNMDWIIKIAKDFLDQYTHLQEMIEDGKESIRTLTEEELQALSNKADELETLLQQWYDSHSQDIAVQLSQAIASFITAANEKTAQSIASIPDDYTTLSNTVNTANNKIKLAVENANSMLKSEIGFNENMFDGEYENRFISASTGIPADTLSSLYVSSKNFIPTDTWATFFTNIPNISKSASIYVYYYDANKTYISHHYMSPLQETMEFHRPVNTTRYMKFMIIYSDTTPVSQIDKWLTLTNKPLKNYVMAYKREITSEDINYVIEPGSYNVNQTGIESIQNLPEQFGGTLVIFQGFGGGPEFVTQMYFSSSNNAFYRFVLLNGTAFSAWNKLNTNFDEPNYLKRVILTSETASSIYGGISKNFELNTEIACANGWFSDMADLPNGWYVVKTMPTSQNTGLLSQRLQIAYSGLGTNGLSAPSNNVMAIRYIINSDTFSDWIFIYNRLQRTPLYIAFGDSVCRGNHSDASKSVYAWPEAFGRYAHIKCISKAIGGQALASTRYAEKALTTIQSTDITEANLITLAFGINDASDPNVTIGTINDTTQNTVLGELYKCISYIYSQNKKVQIVICGTTRQSGQWTTRLAEVNEKLKQFSEKYNLAFIDMTQCPINQFNGGSNGVLTTDGTHFTDAGYILLSQYMVGQLSKYFGN